VYARSNASASKPAGGRALFIIDLDGSHERQLTPWSAGADGTPDWSSTNLIVFRAVADEESGNGNFFTVHPDGTALTQITHFTDRSSATRSGSPLTASGSSSPRRRPAAATTSSPPSPTAPTRRL